MHISRTDKEHLGHKVLALGLFSGSTCLKPVLHFAVVPKKDADV